MARSGSVIVVLVALAAGIPSLLPGFIHDDHRLIEQNELLRDVSRVPEILTRGYWTVGDADVRNLYRPVTILSFLANRVCCGLRPFGFRAVNLGLHALVALLVLLLARRVLGPPRPDRPLDGAIVTALLFAVHPVHTEVLGLVVGRGDLLAAAGTLASVLLFLAARDRDAAGDRRGALLRDTAAVAAFLSGFFSKENAVAAPFIVLAADRTRPWRALPHAEGHSAETSDAGGGRTRSAWGVHAAFFAALILGLLVRTAVLGMVGPAAFTPFVDNPIAQQRFPVSTWTALAVLARYAGLLIAPVRLCIDYSFDAIPPARTLFAIGPAIGAGLTLAAAAVTASTWRRRPAVAFSLLFTGLALLPVANLLIPIGTIMAERLLYLPSVGVCLLAGAAAGGLRPAGRTGWGMARAAATALVVVFGARSVVRLLDWRDDRTIFARAVAISPRSVRAQFNLGVASEQAGDDESARAAYGRALAIWADFSDAHYNLAGLAARHQQWDEAVDHYREALRGQPGNVSYLVNLGNSLTHAGRAAEALDPLQRAVSLEATSDRAWTNLGAAWFALGRADEAGRAWREAERLDARNADYAMNVAIALETGGDAAGAAQEWAKAARLRPADPILRYREGRALEKAGSVPAAAEAYRASIDLSPASPVPLRALGLLLARTGETAAARQALERALVLDTAGTVMDPEARRVLETLRGASPAPPGGRS